MIKIKNHIPETNLKQTLKIIRVSDWEIIRAFRAPGQREPNFVKWCKMNMVETERGYHLSRETVEKTENRIKRMDYFDKITFEKKYRRHQIP